MINPESFTENVKRTFQFGFLINEAYSSYTVIPRVKHQSREVISGFSEAPPIRIVREYNVLKE